MISPTLYDLYKSNSHQNKVLKPRIQLVTAITTHWKQSLSLNMNGQMARKRKCCMRSPGTYWVVQGESWEPEAVLRGIFVSLYLLFPVLLPHALPNVCLLSTTSMVATMDSVWSLFYFFSWLTLINPLKSPQWSLDVGLSNGTKVHDSVLPQITSGKCTQPVSSMTSSSSC